MPEAPEVSYLTKYISKRYKGQVLKRGKILRGRYVKHGVPENFDEFVRSSPSLEEVTKKGKVMFMRFSGGWYVICKLGLMGWWYADGDKPDWIRKSVEPNIAFEFQKGSTLYFTDMLSYGTLTFTKSITIVDREREKLAVDISLATLDDIRENLVRKRNERYWSTPKTIEEVIVDQRAVVSGIGNYLKSEILYEARISPKRHVTNNINNHDDDNNISMKDWKKILEASRTVMKRMKKAIGSSVAYTDALQIYTKEYDKYGNKVETYTSPKTGRKTYWVPALQK